MERLQFTTAAALLTGLAFAGAVLEAIAIFSYQRIGFGLLFGRGRLGLLALPLLIFTGPLIVARAVWDARPGGVAGVALRVAGAGLALGWAIASGHLLLRIVAAFGQ